ncbi:MAG: hypothetical protein VX278_01310, partial [Myxococcota bacterium]|nr:hypothetical protein [Myxococcota bacterium]
MKRKLNFVELDSGQVQVEDLDLLEILPIGIDVQSSRKIRASIYRSEWGKYWFSLVLAGGFLLITGIAASALHMACTIVALPSIFLLLRGSISDEEMATNINRLSNRVIVENLEKAKLYLRKNPFIIRKRFTVYENLPHLIRLDQMITKCKEESNNTCLQLSFNQNALQEMLKTSPPTDQNLIQLQARVEVLAEAVQSFEATYSVLLSEENRLQQERERIRMSAQNASQKRFWDVFEHPPLTQINHEQMIFHER